jgi:hypothetical protein
LEQAAQVELIILLLQQAVLILYLARLPLLAEAVAQIMAEAVHLRLL